MGNVLTSRNPSTSLGGSRGLLAAVVIACTGNQINRQYDWSGSFAYCV